MKQAPCKSLRIGEQDVSEAAPVYILAEIACAHQGEPDKAESLIDLAADAGADGVQLELFDAPNNLAPQSHLYETVCRLQFSPEIWEKLFVHARHRRLGLFAFVYDRPSFDLSMRLGPDAFKLNSSDLSNPELLAPVAESGLPYTLGTGASSLKEIAESLRFVLSRGGDQIILMHGVQNFPTPIVDADIGRVERLRRFFDTLVGYADHTAGDDALSGYIDLIALGAGACLIEKHIILDRSADGVDREAALEPGEFKAYVERIRALAPAVGTRKLSQFTEGCLRYRRFQKKVAVARVPIETNEVLDRSKIIYLRHPDPGLSPFEMEVHLGRRVTRRLAAFEAISSSDISTDSE